MSTILLHFVCKAVLHVTHVTMHVMILREMTCIKSEARCGIWGFVAIVVIYFGDLKSVNKRYYF